MSYSFFIPCEPDSIVEAKISNDGKMVINDPEVMNEIKDILISIKMGFSPPDDDEMSLCAYAYFDWLYNPEGFICNSGLIPINDAGYVACFWAKTAMENVRDIHQDYCIVADRAINRAQDYFLGRPIRYRRILDDKRGILDILASFQSFYMGRLNFPQHGNSFRCVAALMDLITQIELQQTTIGYIDDVSLEICEVYFRLVDALKIDTYRLNQEHADREARAATLTALFKLQQIKDEKR